MKVALVVLVLLLPVTAGAIEWRTANQVTVAWDAVTKLVDGSAIPSGSTVQYLVLVRTDPNGTPVIAATTTATQVVVTLTSEGKFHVGVTPQRMVAGQVVSEGLTAWSNNPLYAKDGKDWGVVYYLPLSSTKVGTVQ